MCVLVLLLHAIHINLRKWTRSMIAFSHQNAASILCQESHDYDLISKPLKDTNIYDSCVSEAC